MRANVLGPLTLRHGALSGVPSAMKPRKILSLLLLSDGRMVPVQSLMAELWGDKPPRTGLTTLQTYILHLRKLLAQVLGTSSAAVTRDVLPDPARRVRVSPALRSARRPRLPHPRHPGRMRPGGRRRTGRRRRVPAGPRPLAGPRPASTSPRTAARCRPRSPGWSSPGSPPSSAASRPGCGSAAIWKC